MNTSSGEVGGGTWVGLHPPASPWIISYVGDWTFHWDTSYLLVIIGTWLQYCSLVVKVFIFFFSIARFKQRHHQLSLAVHCQPHVSRTKYNWRILQKSQDLSSTKRYTKFLRSFHHTPGICPILLKYMCFFHSGSPCFTVKLGCFAFGMFCLGTFSGFVFL